MAEEAAYVAQEYLSSLDNLPAEVAHLLAEIKVKEDKCQDYLSRASNRTQSLLKAVRPTLHLSPSPTLEKEEREHPRIQQDFDKLLHAQAEKVALAERLALLIEKHVKRLELEVLGKVAELGGVEVPRLARLETIDREASRRAESPGPLTIQQQHAGVGSRVMEAMMGQDAQQQHQGSGGSSNKKRRVSNMSQSLGSPSLPIGSLPYPLGSSSYQQPPQTQYHHQSAQSFQQQQQHLPQQQGHIPHPNQYTNRDPAAVQARQQQQHQQQLHALQQQQNQHQQQMQHQQGQMGQHPSIAFPTSAAASSSAARAGGSSSSSSSSNKRARAAAAAAAAAALASAQEDADDDADGGAGAGAQAVVEEEEDQTLYCYCKRKSYGDMVGCDNRSCTIEWYHMDCVGLQEAPPDTWFCPTCKALAQREADKLAAATAAAAASQTSTPSSASGRGGGGRGGSGRGGGGRAQSGRGGRK